MEYLVQPRGPGTAYQFRKKTPAVLVGRLDTVTGRPFPGTIKRGLGTSHLPTARKRRDEILGTIRRAEREAARVPVGSLVGDDMAEAWRVEIAAQDARGGPDEEAGEVDVRSIAEDFAERAARKYAREPAVVAQVTRFRNKALRRGFPLAKALADYVEARAPGNRSGYKELSPGAVNDLHTCVRYLAEHLGQPADEAVLEDVTQSVALRFRTRFLPEKKTRKAPLGLGHQTVTKHGTLLNGLWRWALEREHVEGENPWENRSKLVPRTKRGPNDETRTMFTPEDTKKLLGGLARGSRLGDLFRLALVTGCRMTEVAKVRAGDLVMAGVDQPVAFRVRGGKTDNAARFVPVPAIARDLLARTPDAEFQRQTRTQAKARDRARDEADRLFVEFPIKASSGAASEASELFTAARREILGVETDGRLSLHSTRHTWRTIARREGIAEDVVNDLGGWAGQRRSSSTYDHGLLETQLAEAQAQIAARLERDGYLTGW